MANSYFQFKQFIVHHDRSAMKVTTDACLFGAWVASSISQGQWESGSVNLLDVGTGTGLLSLMVAQKVKGFIDAVEIDENAAGQAIDNIANSPWKESINIICSDVLQWETTKKYDCIFSNPPFYENDLRSERQTKNIAHHDHGLKLSDLLYFIANQLTEDGFFFLLLPAKRAAEVDALITSQELFVHETIQVQQTPKHPSFRLLIRGGRKPALTQKNGLLSIKDENDQYTPAFVFLLKDYYLYL